MTTRYHIEASVSADVLAEILTSDHGPLFKITTQRSHKKFAAPKIERLTRPPTIRAASYVTGYHRGIIGDRDVDRVFKIVKEELGKGAVSVAVGNIQKAMTKISANPRNVSARLCDLHKRYNFVKQDKDGHWSLTEAGKKASAVPGHKVSG